MPSAGAMLPSAIEEIWLDILSVGMKRLSSISYFPHVDVVGWPQCAVQPVSAIVVRVVPFKTTRQILSSCHSSSPSPS